MHDLPDRARPGQVMVDTQPGPQTDTVLVPATRARQASQLKRKPYNHPLRLNAMYKPPDSTMMSKLDQMNPLVLAKPGYGKFCP
jgi:hypothetical protein